jgi:hypothetical protein
MPYDTQSPLSHTEPYTFGWWEHVEGETFEIRGEVLIYHGDRPSRDDPGTATSYYPSFTAHDDEGRDVTIALTDKQIAAIEYDLIQHAIDAARERAADRRAGRDE